MSKRIGWSVYWLLYGKMQVSQTFFGERVDADLWAKKWLRVPFVVIKEG